MPRAGTSRECSRFPGTSGASFVSPNTSFSSELERACAAPLAFGAPGGSLALRYSRLRGRLQWREYRARFYAGSETQVRLRRATTERYSASERAARASRGASRGRPFAIAAGERARVAVGYKSQFESAERGTLWVFMPEGCAEIEVHGGATDQGVFTYSDWLTDFGTVAPGATVQRKFTVLYQHGIADEQASFGPCRGGGGHANRRARGIRTHILRTGGLHRSPRGPHGARTLQRLAVLLGIVSLGTAHGGRRTSDPSVRDRAMTCV